MTIDLALAVKGAVNWDQFVEMFQEEYVLLVEKEQLAQEYLSLQQIIETVTEINQMFHKRAMFCPDYASTEQVWMN